MATERKSCPRCGGYWAYDADISVAHFPRDYCLRCGYYEDREVPPPTIDPERKHLREREVRLEYVGRIAALRGLSFVARHNNGTHRYHFQCPYCAMLNPVYWTTETWGKKYEMYRCTRGHHVWASMEEGSWE